jgi:NADPH:quinone reductase-like Zn-dependent oxidoreductase
MGIVEEVGSAVTELAPGDRVVALTRFGGYTDMVCVPATLALPLPAHLSFEQAAALPVNYVTAWIMLVHVGGVRTGDRVLVHAAAGGVGQAAIQLCRWRGAEVIGTASAAKHDRLRAAGVAHTIDYTTQDFEAEVRRLTDGRGVDIVLDAVGGESLRKSYRSLAPLGRLFMFGVSSIAPGERRSWLAAARGLVRTPFFHPVRLMNDNRGVFGVNVGHLWREGPRLRAMLVELLALVKDGTLSPVVDRTFPLDEAPAAHRYLQERRNFGKVLLVP